MSASLPIELGASAAIWPAQLQLRFACHESLGTRLVECVHSGPLRVQRPFYPEGNGCAHVYLLHPPGGLVSGDELAIRIDVDAQAHALITTPGAGRIYRARSAPVPARQAQCVRLSVGAHATLEWLPQATIVFDGAEVLLDLHVDVSAESTFIGWETICLGRPASDLPFTRGSVEQHWRVRRDGVPLLNDRLCVDGSDDLRAACWGLQDLPVYGTFLAVPREQQPLTMNSLTILRNALEDMSAQTEIAATLVRGMLIARYLGDSTERAHTLFDLCWRQLRPLLNDREAVRPRIWNT